MGMIYEDHGRLACRCCRGRIDQRRLREIQEAALRRAKRITMPRRGCAQRKWIRVSAFQ